MGGGSAAPRRLRCGHEHIDDVLIPGETLVGHGPFRFRLVEWDGRRWRVEILGHASGWHGFDLVEENGRTRVTHTLQLERLRGGRLATRALIIMHDWAVEAILDRLGEAVRTGAMPRHTVRPLPWLARLLFALKKRTTRRPTGLAQETRARSA